MPRRKPEPQEFGLTDLFDQLGNQLKVQARTPNIDGYIPHAKQAKFHQAQRTGRLYIGGNRSGKTFGSVAEDIYYARGRHPHRRIPGNGEPTRGRVVAVDYDHGVGQIILPIMQRLLPPSELIDGSWERSFSKGERVLTLANKSTIEFMSYEADLEKFAGTSRHWIHFDEEPPKHIYNECLARLVDTDGDWWISMTPVEGMTWLYEDIYEPAITGQDEDVDVIEADMLDNPHISEEAAEKFLKRLGKEEREAREKGKFVQLGGLVFKDFSTDIHVVDQFVPPKDWLWYLSLDHGFNNPTAVYWHAVSPDNDVVTFAEHYASEMLVEQHATLIHARNAGFGRVPDVFVCDPALSQRNGVTGTSIHTEYANHGIYFGLGNNDVLSGITRMSAYLKPDSYNNVKWHITENCAELIKEMKKLRWKTYSSRKTALENNKHDQVHKKDDHGFDSCRYFFTLMPDLAPSNTHPVAQATNIGDLVHAGGQNYDAAMQKSNQQAYHETRTDWRIEGQTGSYGGMEWD